MKPQVVNNYDVRARCPECDGALSTFDSKVNNRELGYHIINGTCEFEEQNFSRTHYKLLRCSGCGRAGLAKFYDNGQGPGVLASFYPRAIVSAALPVSTPDGIANEYREAELCASFEAWRAASVLLRSTLEKALTANGYKHGSLYKKIDAAADDGVITAARRQKAHDDVRVLGNEVVHEDWKQVSEDEVQGSLHYTQRILEDLYDERAEVEKILLAKSRI